MFFMAQSSLWFPRKGGFQDYFQKEHQILILSPFNHSRSSAVLLEWRKMQGLWPTQAGDSLGLPRGSPAEQAAPGCHLCLRGCVSSVSNLGGLSKHSPLGHPRALEMSPLKVEDSDFTAQVSLLVPVSPGDHWYKLRSGTITGMGSGIQWRVGM